MRLSEISLAMVLRYLGHGSRLFTGERLGRDRAAFHTDVFVRHFISAQWIAINPRVTIGTSCYH